LTTNIDFFKKELKSWYKDNQKSFEWRGSHNPWKILLIETLSQQTQIERADEFYKKFINKYPTPQDMAKDSKKEILKLWSGLGYNNRAIRLYESSKVLSRHSFDELYPDFTILPGVGPYTNSAILSFAYEEKVIAVDTNIKRIIQRFFKIENIDIFLQKNSDALLKNFKSRDFNQGLMDLGATICKSKNPSCNICPLEDSCNKFILRQTSKQKKFVGSMRQRRGLVLKMLLSEKKVTRSSIKKELKVSNADADDILNSLKKDRLITVSKNKVIVINDN
jgi:A/G-specific adenine glycosylase